MSVEKSTALVVSFAKEILQAVGPGFNERIYINALKVALDQKNIDFESDQDFSVFYKDDRVGSFKCDIVIENALLVCVCNQSSNNTESVKSMLKAANLKQCLMLNFSSSTLVTEEVKYSK